MSNQRISATSDTGETKPPLSSSSIYPREEKKYLVGLRNKICSGKDEKTFLVTATTFESSDKTFMTVFWRGNSKVLSMPTMHISYVRSIEDTETVETPEE